MINSDASVTSRRELTTWADEGDTINGDTLATSRREPTTWAGRQLDKQGRVGNFEAGTHRLGQGET